MASRTRIVGVSGAAAIVSVPMISAASLRQPPPAVDRSRDRVVVALAIGIAVAFLVASLLTTLLPVGVRRGSWLPLHLALAGAATTAIAGVMPFFSAAFAAAPPTDVRLRLGAVASVSLGAIGVSLGVVGGSPTVAVAGGIVFVVGVVWVGIATLRPVRRALGPSRGIVVQGYVAALVEVGVGATLATLYLAAWPPLVENWGHVKPAHAWLNLLGFVSVVVGTTLLHFWPTVVGARMAARPSARITVLGLVSGPVLVALGFAFELDLVGRLGALLTVAGYLALVAYVVQTWRTRGRWTTDPMWHRFAIGGLVSAIVWFGVGLALGAGRVILLGTDPEAWSIDAVLGPLVAGWIGFAVVASASHLLPAVGPGDLAAHARQRAVLGRATTARLAVANVGVAALSIGLLFQTDVLVMAGTALVALGLGSTALLLAIAALLGRAVKAG
jgi:nitrite reductase (NO-forming)